MGDATKYYKVTYKINTFTIFETSQNKILKVKTTCFTGGFHFYIKMLLNFIKSNKNRHKLQGISIV